MTHTTFTRSEQWTVNTKIIWMFQASISSILRRFSFFLFFSLSFLQCSQHFLLFASVVVVKKSQNVFFIIKYCIINHLVLHFRWDFFVTLPPLLAFQFVSLALTPVAVVIDTPIFLTVYSSPCELSISFQFFGWPVRLNVFFVFVFVFVKCNQINGGKEKKFKIFKFQNGHTRINTS